MSPRFYGALDTLKAAQGKKKTIFEIGSEKNGDKVEQRALKKM